MSESNLELLIEMCENGEYEDVAKQGSVPCYAIDEDYVLVRRNANKVENSERFTELNKKLKESGYKCIYTVTGYQLAQITDKNGSKVDVVYELQRRAKGEHFRIDETKQDSADMVNSLYRNIKTLKRKIDEEKDDQDMVETYESFIAKDRERIEERMNFRQTEKYKSLIETRGKELMRRHNMIIEMPKQHIVDFFDSVLTLHDNKIEYDSSGNNVLYDSQNGFGIIDLSDCSNRDGMVGKIEDMLAPTNYQTMGILIAPGEQRVKDEEKEEVMETMKQALKKICVSVYDFEHNGKKMTRDIMETSLKKYEKYGVNLSLEEVEEEYNKSRMAEQNKQQPNEEER